MGFSAGAELATAAAVLYDDFDKKNSGPGDPLAGISSRPDFVGVIYPGPTPFARDRVAPPIPHNVPPSFIASAGSDDQIHAIWADEYFAAMLALRVPNLEMHIYANGRHPGDPLRDGSHMTGGLTDRKGIPFGTWQYRFIGLVSRSGLFGGARRRNKGSQRHCLLPEPTSDALRRASRRRDSTPRCSRRRIAGLHLHRWSLGPESSGRPAARRAWSSDWHTFCRSHVAAYRWKRSKRQAYRQPACFRRYLCSLPVAASRSRKRHRQVRECELHWPHRDPWRRGGERPVYERRKASSVYGKIQLLHRQTMTNIHHVAAEGFALGAASYVAGRPDYPPEIEDWLTHDLGLTAAKRHWISQQVQGSFRPGC